MALASQLALTAYANFLLIELKITSESKQRTYFFTIIYPMPPEMLKETKD